MNTRDCETCLYRIKCNRWSLPSVIPDHSLLSPSGKVSNRAYKSAHDKQNSEFREYFGAIELANDDYLKSTEAITKTLYQQSVTRRNMARLVARPKQQQRIIQEADDLLIAAKAMEAQISTERPSCYNTEGERDV